MRKHALAAAILILTIVTLACGSGSAGSNSTPAPIPTLANSPLSKKTVYGFFPSPPEISQQSVVDLYKAMGQHADVVLLQESIPWNDFARSEDAPSQAITDIHNQYIQAHQNGLDAIFVADPLNGLNRREFENLPKGWQPSFATADVRSAFTNFVLRIVREFHPHYLGLGSEINTYEDTHPQDFPNYLSLYNSVYDLVKAEAPDTQIFVTFQWEELNNLMALPGNTLKPYQTNWKNIEIFEPKLDLWVISTYPFVVFKSGADIPGNYYTPLLGRTSKPLAVAEGGFSSQAVGPLHGSTQDQIDYLKAIHTQIGSRMAFWIYLLFNDFNLASYGGMMLITGHAADIPTLGMFSTLGLRQYDGTPKPALATWDSYRNGP
ncbi:MAG: hypothetical protein P4L50_00490 [Anaerolineaceae bacterium]|nr:hypothetical protein [Anaerolineaceae bacterium]